MTKQRFARATASTAAAMAFSLFLFDASSASAQTPSAAAGASTMSGPSTASGTPGTPGTSAAPASATGSAAGSVGSDPKATDANLRSASLHFERGVELYRDEDYRLALVEFQRSYELVPDYRFLYNTGEVYFQLGNFAQALKTLRRYLASGGDKIEKARRDQVEADIEALKIRTGFLNVHSNVEGADVIVDGEKLGVTPLAEKQVVNGGAHKVQVAKAGFVTGAGDVTLVGAESKDITINLVPEAPKEEHGGIEPYWIGWGVTALLAAGTIGFAASWGSAQSQLNNDKNSLTSTAVREQDVSDVNTRRDLTIGFGAGTVVAAGISLYFTLHHGKSDQPKTASGITSVSPFGIAGAF